MSAILTHKLNIDKTGWTLVKFDDVVAEGRETVKDFAAEDIQHVVGLEHIDTENIHLTRWDSMAESTTFTKKFKKGDVLFGRRRAYLKKAAQAPFSGICSGDITVLRAKKGLLPELLPFLVCNDKFFDYAIKHSAGGLSPRVKFKDLAHYEFLLPPRDQQAKLAELLWAMDEVVEKEIRLLKSILEYLESFKEKVLMSGDKFVRLEKLISGITAGKSVNGVNTPAVHDEKGVLKVSAVGPNGFDPNENKVITNQADFETRYALQKGDILITRANTTELVGRVCLVPHHYPNQMLCDKTLRLEIYPNVDKHFLIAALSSRFIRNQIEGFATGTGGAMKNISQPEIRSLKIPVKSTVEQANLGETIRAANEKIEMVREKITISKSLQKSLINQIF